MNSELQAAAGWICAKCEQELIPKKIKLNYLNKDFEHELMCCPNCGQVFIGEDLAMGKMLEVERSLEDK